MSDKKIDLTSTEKPWDAPTKKCDSCGVIYYEAQLARFGKRKNSPMICKPCASAQFNERAEVLGMPHRVKT